LPEPITVSPGQSSGRKACAVAGLSEARADLGNFSGAGSPWFSRSGFSDAWF